MAESYSSFQILADQRARFAHEMEADPNVRDRLYSLTHREVGGQGADAQHAFIESLMNRAVARDQTLKRAMSHDYYPGRSLRYSPGKDYSSALNASLGGSNRTHLATGNASEDVGFGGGPTTYRSGGDRFGIEVADVGWARSTASALGNPLSAPATRHVNVAQNGPQMKPVAQAAGDLVMQDLTGQAHRSFGQLDGGKPVGMIIHHTSANEKDAAQVGRALYGRGLGVQYVIDREGNISRLLPEGERGAHMRAGTGPGAGLGNQNMAGVEIIGDPAGGVPINDKQIAAAGKLIGWHSQKYGYDPKTSVFGHGEVNAHKERLEGMEVVSRLRDGTLDLSVGKPKPGSQAYWEQGRASKAASSSDKDKPVWPRVLPKNGERQQPAPIEAPHPQPAARPRANVDPIPAPAPRPAVRPKAADGGATAPNKAASARPMPPQPKDAPGPSARPRASHAAPSSPAPSQGAPSAGRHGSSVAGSDVGLGAIHAADETTLPEGEGEVTIEVYVPMSFV